MNNYVEFKDKFYCKLHRVSFDKSSKCNQCDISPYEIKVVEHKSVLEGYPNVSYGTTENTKKEVQSTLTNNLLTIANKSRRVYNRTKIIERFHAYRIKFNAVVLWDHLFSYEEFSLNNNVKFKRIDFPEAIVRVFKKSILVTIRSSMEVKGLNVVEAKKRSDMIVADVVSKLPKAITIKDSKISSVHNAFINDPMAKQNVSVKVNNEVRWISDNSKGNPEFEAVHTEFAIPDSEKYEKDMVALIDKGLSREALAESIRGLIDVQEYHAENMRSHIIAIKEMAFMLKLINRRRLKENE